MAITSVIIKLDSGGMRALLTSPGVQGDTLRRAQAVARAAGEGFEAKATPRARRGRSEAFTATYAARQKQAKRGALISAISAARR